MRCDCGNQLHTALQQIETAGSGVLLYMRQEGRGIGLPAKIHAYKLQEEGLDTVEANEKLGFPAELRDYGLGAQILVDLGVRKMRFLTNNPKKVIGLEGYGLEIVEVVPIRFDANPHNAKYLETKRVKMGHFVVRTKWRFANGSRSVLIGIPCPHLRFTPFAILTLAPRMSNILPTRPRQTSQPAAPFFAIIASQYNPAYVRALVDHATRELERRRTECECLHLRSARAHLRSPCSSRKSPRSAPYDAIIALGVIIEARPSMRISSGRR